MNRAVFPFLVVSPMFLMASTPLLAMDARAGAASTEHMGYAKIRDSGEIVLGFRSSSPPFSSVRSDKAKSGPIGYSIDLCYEVVDEIRQRLSRTGGATELRVRWVEVGAENRIEKVADGNVDIVCGATTHTFERQERVEFSSVVFVTGARVLVRSELEIDSLGDFRRSEYEGKRIGVVAGTTTVNVLRRQMQSHRLPEEMLVVISDHKAAIAELEHGRIHALVSDEMLLAGHIQSQELSEKFKIVGSYMSYEPYALMIGRDPELRLIVNRRLAKLFGDGRIEDYVSKWFGPLGWKGIPDILRAAFLIQNFPEK